MLSHQNDAATKMMAFQKLLRNRWGSFEIYTAEIKFSIDPNIFLKRLGNNKLHDLFEEAQTEY